MLPETGIVNLGHGLRKVDCSGKGMCRALGHAGGRQILHDRI